MHPIPSPAGARWSIAGQGVVAACQFLQFVVLARLLSASDFGMGAIFLVLAAASQLAWDLGTSTAIVQRREITQDQLSTLHLLNIVSGILFAALLWACAPAIAGAIDQPDAADLLQWAAAVPVIAAVGGQFRALHLRHMDFRMTALIDIATAVTSCCAAIVAASQGTGAYAFVIAFITGAIINTLLLVASGAKFRTHGPAWQPAGIGHFLRFGGYQTGSALINFVYLNLDLLMLSSLLDTAELGMYALARQLCLGALEIVRPILVRGLLPQLARLQDDAAAMRTHFLDVFKVFNALYLPAFAAVIVTAEQLVPLVFGTKWQDAAVVLQILAAAHVVRFLMVPSSISLMATGRVSRGFYWDIAISGLLVAIVILLHPQSATSMAGILLGVYAFALLPHWYLIVHGNLHVGFTQWLWVIARPLGITTVSASIAWWAASGANFPVIQLLVTVAVGLGVYCLLTLWLNRPALRAAGWLRPTGA